MRDWLTDRGVAFTEFNVTGDERAAIDLLATGSFGTPLLVVGDVKVIGFWPVVLAAAFGLTEGEG